VAKNGFPFIFQPDFCFFFEFHLFFKKNESDRNLYSFRIYEVKAHKEINNDSIIFIYYINFIESMTTTIAISNEMKENLKNLGRAGDTYEDVIRRMYEATRKILLTAYLYDETDSVPIEEAISEAKKKWPKS